MNNEIVYEKEYAKPVETICANPRNIPVIRAQMEKGKQITFANSVSPESKQFVIFDGGIDYRQVMIANTKFLDHYKKSGKALIRYEGNLYQYAIAK